MPTRIVREGILTSEPVNRLTMRAELFYRRLISVADDHGRYFAHPSILRANCYPLRLNEVSEADVKQMLSECEAVNLLTVYNDGKHLQIHKFGQQTRSKSKFPDFIAQKTENPPLINCKSNEKQMLSLVGVVGEGEVGVVGENVVGETGGDVPQKTTFETYREKLNEMYGRKQGTPWSYLEESKLAECVRRPEFESEFSELSKFRSEPNSFFPRSVERLLTDWNAVLDRSRNSIGEIKTQLSANTEARLRQEELKEVLAKISKIEDSDSHLGISQADADKLKKLKARRRELKQQLGWKV